MPTPIKHIPPNFVINRVKGWNTRLLYNFYGSLNYQFDYIIEAASTTDNLFDLIHLWQSVGLVNETVYKGQWSFGQYSNFFKTGKSIRVKGCFLASRDDINQQLNMRARIENLTTTITTDIAASNRGYNHTFAGINKDTSVIDVPVNFEITYNCIEDSDGPGLYFQANGFYQYECEFYFDGGANNSIIYVPIWVDTQSYISVGEPSDEYKLYINFAGTTINKIVLRYLTIEELS